MIKLKVRKLPVLVTAILAIQGAHALGAEKVTTFKGAQGVTLAGTWTTPDGPPPERGWPAAVLIQGSGQTDREGNQPPRFMPGTLRQLAQHLAEQGVATLRYDKRGMHANIAVRIKERTEPATFFTWDNFIGDVGAAVDHVAGLPDVNPERVALIGHGLGGTFALAAGDKNVSKVRAVGLLATPARPMGEVLTDRLKRDFERQGLPEDRIKTLLALNAEIQAEIIRAGMVPDTIPPELRAIHSQHDGRLYQRLFQFQPLEVLNRLDKPTLAIIGTKDRLVSAERDGALFVKALGARRDGSFVVLPPGVSHALKTVIEENPRSHIDGNINASVLVAIEQWITVLR